MTVLFLGCVGVILTIGWAALYGPEPFSSLAQLFCLAIGLFLVVEIPNREIGRPCTEKAVKKQDVEGNQRDTKVVE